MFLFTFATSMVSPNLDQKSFISIVTLFITQVLVLVDHVKLDAPTLDSIQSVALTYA